jgi:hypothetical protein
MVSRYGFAGHMAVCICLHTCMLALTLSVESLQYFRHSFIKEGGIAVKHSWISVGIKLPPALAAL